MNTEYQIQDLDHLGIVSGICDQIGLVEIIDEYIGPQKRKVSVGTAVKAMILNGLGMSSRHLYLTPEFYSNKPTELLLGKGILPEDLNDDSLGRALDILFEKGLSNIFALISNIACDTFNISTSSVHMDTTSLSLSGEYSEEEENAVHITYGHSKDKRPDLKQVIIGLICAYKTKIPLFFKSFDGNANDNKSFVSMIQDFVGQLKEGESFPRVIADSAMYTENILSRLPKDMLFVSRVPATLSQVKKCIAQADAKSMTLCSDPRYRYQWHNSDYAGVPQSWLLLRSQPAFLSAKKSLDKRIEKDKVSAEKRLRAHARRRFGCHKDAEESLRSLEKPLRYHKPQLRAVLEHKKYSKAGNPGKNAQPILTYSVQTELFRDEEAIEQASQRLGFFVLSTNEVGEERPDADSLLSDYKSQSSSIETGFRFIKDPMFFADALYLKKPSRIMSLTMIMSLCLLVYALAEDWLRSQLLLNNETLPNQVGKQTNRITIRRVFQMFEGIHLLSIHVSGHVHRQVSNLNDVHKQILRLLGPLCQQPYLLSG